MLIWIPRAQFRILFTMSTLALSELLGSTVYDSTGAASGRVREVALAPQEDRSEIAAIIVKTPSGNRLLPLSAFPPLMAVYGSPRQCEDWAQANGAEGLLLLSRDLLDQQVIDVHGRKVVRVNDVDFHQRNDARTVPLLKIGGVDVGARGAVRRLLKGVVPGGALRALLHRLPQREIPGILWT